MDTPWGIADHVKDIGLGIKRVDTPSHGGYFVPDEMLKKMPPATHKTFAGKGWYEEDCDWCMVVLSFPELFPAINVGDARRCCALFMSKQVCNAFGITKTPGTSFVE